MSDVTRRDFLDKGWKAGIVMIGAAGMWTSWDVLRPLPGSGFGGVIKTIPVSEIPSDSTVYIRAAKGYLTMIDGEIVALWQKCPHLGCRVPWCDSAGEFECPCHGSVFNRAGDYREGPSPRGMDRFAISVVDGVVHVDTGNITPGSPAGTAETIDEPPAGPRCLDA